MKKLAVIYMVLLLGLGGVLIAYSPDRLTTIILGVMAVLILLGMFLGIIPTLMYVDGFRTGISNIEKSLDGQSGGSWVSVLEKEHFFNHSVLDGLLKEYRDKVNYQRKNNLIITDIDEYINESVLAYKSWQVVLNQIPGTLTGLGILGTFLGLIMGIGDISISSVDATVESIQVLLNGVEVAFYTSIAGVSLSIVYNFIHKMTWNILNREIDVFLNRFHKQVIPTVEEQTRFRERQDLQMILERLDRIPKKEYSFAGYEEKDSTGDEKVLLPQIVEGLKREEFKVYLQPRYNIITNEVIGAEALVRWNHEKLGIVSPNEFMPLLEKNGYITKLDQYIWEAVLKNIRRWIDDGKRVIPISVNITKTDILALDVGEVMDTLLQKYKIPPRYFEIDVGRSIYTDTKDEAKNIIEHLRSMGFLVVLDGFDGDFLRLEADEERIAVDALKLDLRRISSADEIPAVFDMAARLNYKVIVEGIENMEQIKILRKCGCAEGQGYYYSKPLKIQEFEDVFFDQK